MNLKITIMKNILSITVLVLLGLFVLPSCEEDNELIFTAVPSEEGIVFSNDFAANYLLSPELEDNIAERFVWDEADFGAPTNVSYDLQASLSATLDSFDLVGTTTANQISVTIGRLLEYGEALGLDNDPNTTGPDGNPNNEGTVYFRVRAYAGSGTGNATEMQSDIVGLNIELVEQEPTGACDGMFALGDALVDAQWDWGTALSIPCEQDVLSAKINFTNGIFRFFTTQDDWASGLNYPYFVEEGYTIDANFEDAMDGDNNFMFIGTPGIYELIIDQNAKTITLEESGPLWLVGEATPGGWDWPGATAAFEEEVDVWTTTLELNNGTFRFFTAQDDWDSGLNYPYFAEEGYTIDDNFEDAMDGDNNFMFTGTPGTYTVTVDGKNKTITLN